jgi:hypothetical protein
MTDPWKRLDEDRHCVHAISQTLPGNPSQHHHKGPMQVMANQDCWNHQSRYNKSMIFNENTNLL